MIGYILGVFGGIEVIFVLLIICDNIIVLMIYLKN